jgi:uncharacterized protein (TIGR02444 family)
MARSDDAGTEGPWPFALAFYARPGNAAACLALQDAYGADVVLLIGLLWLAARDGRAAEAVEIDLLDAAVAPWRETVVMPLRALRRALKPQLPDLPATAGHARDRIKDAELQSERVAFDLLANAIATLVPARRVDAPQAAARVSIERYFARLGHAPTPALRALSEPLVGALDEFAGASLPKFRQS